MFIHNFKYSLKTLFKNRMLIFWTFAFPIILGTFFNLAFSNIENSEKLDIIDIAIVETEEFLSDEIYSNTFKTLSDEQSDDRLFNTRYVTLDKAEELLRDGQIVGYLFLKEEPKIVINTSGIDETIFKHVTEEISQTKVLIADITNKKIQDNMTSEENLAELYGRIMNEVSELIQNKTSNIVDTSNDNLSYTMIEFYTLIAMACLYGALLGITSINGRLANMSNKGKRVAISPVSKRFIIASSLLASYVAQVIGVALLFIYTIFVLKVDYGTNLPLIILLALVGCLAGLSLGISVGTLLKSNEDTKTGIVIAITMLGCFLSGMMGITMKYIVDKNIPIVNKINPASMITDGFYSLYYYDTLDRYWFNIMSLLIFSGFLIAISMVVLRRQKYDSI